MRCLSSGASYARARMQVVGMDRRSMFSAASNTSLLVRQSHVVDSRHGSRIASLGIKTKAINQILKLRLRKNPTGCLVSRGPSVMGFHSTASSNTSSVSRSTRMICSTNPWYRFHEFLGLSFVVASSAALLVSSSFTFCSNAERQEEKTPLEDSYFPQDPTGTALLRQGETDVLATSALYLDPRVSSLIYQHDGSHYWNGAYGGNGRRGEDENDKSSDNEKNVTTVTSTNSSVDRTNDSPYDLSVRAIKGGRLTMEDTYFVGPRGRFVAVFDGHGGALVSSYLQENLYRLVNQALQRKRWEIDDITIETSEEEAYDRENNNKNNSNSRTRPASIASHVAALRSAYAEAEKHVLQQKELHTQGSTAVAVWIHEAQDGTRTLISANVGDSRAVLSREGQAVDLTQDHKPIEEREKARIKRHGGTIEWDALAKVHRVESLSLSRAIGDGYAKPVVSGEVDIKLFPVVEEKDEFILLASDGLWDVMTSQDVVSYVRYRFESELNRKELTTEEDVENCRLVLRRNMARSIVREAVRRGTGDNVCVLIVWLNDRLLDTSSRKQPQSLEKEKKQ